MIGITYIFAEMSLIVCLKIVDKELIQNTKCFVSLNTIIKIVLDCKPCDAQYHRNVEFVI